jgi:hypothetical protein
MGPSVNQDRPLSLTIERSGAWEVQVVLSGRKRSQGTRACPVGLPGMALEMDTLHRARSATMAATGAGCEELQATQVEVHREAVVNTRGVPTTPKRPWDGATILILPQRP